MVIRMVCAAAAATSAEPKAVTNLQEREIWICTIKKSQN